MSAKLYRLHVYGCTRTDLVTVQGICPKGARPMECSRRNVENGPWPLHNYSVVCNRFDRFG